MQSRQFNQILKWLPTLDPVQKERLNLALNKKGNEILHSLAKECINHGSCLHCDSKRLRKWGYSNGRQRLKCNECNKTFVCTRGSSYFYQHRADDWQPYLEKMLNKDSIRRCAKDIGICVTTAFNWRHRYLKSTENTYEKALQGIVEADETYFRKSNKGQRNLNRKPRKRGTKATTAGINAKDWTAVLTAMDRNQHEYDHILSKVSSSEIQRYLGPKIAPDSVLCTDGQPAYNQLCNTHHLHHIILKNSRVRDGVFHVQNINNYHSQLKSWYRAMHGVATKYLPRYLGWHRLLKWHNYQETENLLDFKLLQVQQHNFKT